MPGTILYDFGDALRSLFTGDNECSKDLDKLKVDFRMYEKYLIGYAYFRVYNEDDNLTRARTQLHLAKDIYQNLDKLNKMTEKILEE